MLLRPPAAYHALVLIVVGYEVVFVKLDSEYRAGIPAQDKQTISKSRKGKARESTLGSRLDL